MTSFVLSTVAFFVAAFFLNRYLDEMGINKGMTRAVLVLVLASTVSLGVSLSMGWLSSQLDGSPTPSGTDTAIGMVRQMTGINLPTPH